LPPAGGGLGRHGPVTGMGAAGKGRRRPAGAEQGGSGIPRRASTTDLFCRSGPDYVV